MENTEVKKTQPKQTLKALSTRVEALEEALITSLLREADLVARLDALEAAPKAKAASGRNYGPKSTTKLDDLTAWRIRYGDRSECTVKQNANFFGLSLGQVYSLDKYTFQHVSEESFTATDIPEDTAAETEAA